MRHLLLFLLILGATFNGALAQPKRVLLLHSDHSPMVWADDITQGVIDVLTPRQRGIDLVVEFMDSKRVFRPDYLDQLAILYQNKYQTRHLDLIIAVDRAALDFLREHGDQVFAGVPVVFCGINEYDSERLKANFTGVVEGLFPLETLELALKLMPQTREVYVVHDFGLSGLGWAKAIKEKTNSLRGQVQFRYNPPLALEALENEVAQLKPGTIVLFSVYSQGPAGQFILDFEAINRLSGVAKVPIYGMLDYNLGQGIAGGVMINGYTQGTEAAKLGLKIIEEGINPGQIPVVHSSANRPMFDFGVLQYFNLSDKLLPSNSLVINRPVSFFKDNKELLLVGLAIIALEATIILWLIWALRARAQAEKALETNQAQLEELVTLRTEALLKSNRDLELLNQEKSEFLGVAAHDLKSPLGGIRGFSELIYDEANNQGLTELATFSQYILDASGKMLGLIDNLLDVSKVETLLAPKLELLSANQIVREGVESFGPQALLKNLEIRLDLADENPLFFSNRHWLAEVLGNLVSNALKFSQSGKKVFISTRLEAGQWTRIAVRDQGPGLTKKDMEKLFEKFQRLSAQPTQGEASTGLGLYIVKKITEQMGGRVWCESEPGRGAEFILEFPSAKSEEPSLKADRA